MQKAARFINRGCIKGILLHYILPNSKGDQC